LKRVEDWPSRASGLKGSSILWIDLDNPDQTQAAELVDGLRLEAQTHAD
jgi:hypothetical protein